MKFCQAHWTKLRAAIAARGLEGLVSQGGEAAVARQADQLKRAQAGDESVTKGNFDPLMAAHWAIVNNALRLVGLQLLAPNDDGTDRCPLCFLTSDHKASCTRSDCPVVDFDFWIERASDDMRDEAKRLGLLGSA